LFHWGPLEAEAYLQIATQQKENLREALKRALESLQAVRLGIIDYCLIDGIDGYTNGTSRGITSVNVEEVLENLKHKFETEYPELF
jgi:hypothetical protein